ncbi:MAG: hypothetical protein ACYDCC_00040 [Actinomycetota bacterium]
MRSRIATLALIVMLIPVAGIARPADATPDCNILPGTITYACDHSGIVKLASVVSDNYGPMSPFAVPESSDPVFVEVDAFEFAPLVVEPATPDRTQQSFARACLMLASRRAFMRQCDIPVSISFDPLLQSATIQGTWNSHKLGIGVVTFNVSITGSSTPSAPDLYQAGGSNCRESGTIGEAAPLVRDGTPSGTVSFAKHKVDLSGAPAILEEYAYTSGDALTPNGCAQSRHSYSDYCSLTFVFIGGDCSASSVERSASVRASTRNVHIFVDAGEVQDPQYVVGSLYPSVSPMRWICIEVESRMSGFGTCEAGTSVVVDIDPLLREATIRGTVSSGDFFFNPLFDLGFGRVGVDLTLAPKGSPSIATDVGASEGAACADAGAGVAPTLLSSSATAVGHIRFERTYGQVKATDATPLEASMDSSLGAGSEAFADCGVPNLTG